MTCRVRHCQTGAWKELGGEEITRQRDMTGRERTQIRRTDAHCFGRGAFIGTVRVLPRANDQGKSRNAKANPRLPHKCRLPSGSPYYVAGASAPRLNGYRPSNAGRIPDQSIRHKYLWRTGHGDFPHCSPVHICAEALRRLSDLNRYEKRGSFAEDCNQKAASLSYLLLVPFGQSDAH